MDEELFEDLLESVREAGAVLRGEREAARATRFPARLVRMKLTVD